MRVPLHNWVFRMILTSGKNLRPNEVHAGSWLGCLRVPCFFVLLVELASPVLRMVGWVKKGNVVCRRVV
jgi:hypothetical protein